MAERTRLLHVHGAYSWHCDVTIVGNSNGLAVLRDALTEALSAKKAETTAMVSDGEGFGVVIERDDAAWESSSWRTKRLPYTDPIACGERDLRFDITDLQSALRKANVELVKRGVKPIPDPTQT